MPTVEVEKQVLPDMLYPAIQLRQYCEEYAQVKHGLEQALTLPLLEPSHNKSK